MPSLCAVAQGHPGKFPSCWLPWLSKCGFSFTLVLPAACLATVTPSMRAAHLQEQGCMCHLLLCSYTMLESDTYSHIFSMFCWPCGVQIALLTAPRSSSRSQSQQQQQANPASLAAIIAPSVVGGCLLAAAAAYGLFLILRRRRRGGSDTGSPSKGGLLPIADMGEFSTGGTRQSGYSGPTLAPLGSLNMQPPYRCVVVVRLLALTGLL